VIPRLDQASAVALYYPSAAGNLTIDQLISLYQGQAAAHPRETSYLDSLADAYVEKARQNGDVTYYNLADAAISRALAIDPRDARALIYRGWVRLAWHQFGEAVTLAHQALAIDPTLSEGYGVLGDGLLELGRYDQVTSVYQQMVDLRPGLTSYNRASYIRWIHGDVRGALTLMAASISAGSAYPENVAWCQVQQGNTFFAIGDLRDAEVQYQAALHTFPGYLHALAGLATVRAAQGRMAEAIVLYHQALAVEPLPQYATALGDLELSLGRRADAEREFGLVEFVDRLYSLNHIQFGIDRAFFEADHDRNLPEAVRLAHQELSVRQDVRTEDSAAWVFYKAGLYREALTVAHAALRYGTPEALYHFHLGMILQALDNRTAAAQELRTALRLNPYFSPRYVPVARAALRNLGGA
jgi:tetratricopeptide (TPR) repeat protein